MLGKKIIIITSLLIAAISVPITLSLVKQTSNKNSHAAAPDKLEAESGILGGKAVITSDTNASGGSYILLDNFGITAGPTSQNITSATAEITWTLSEGGTGQIEYGPTASYGSQSGLESSFTYTTHLQTITGLTAGTTYHYRVKSTNQAGQQITSSDKTFLTLSSAVSPTPVPVSGVGPRSTPTTPVGITVPSSIDGTGATDVSVALSNWVRSQPAGSILIFPSGAIYKLSQGINLTDRSNLTLWGYGAKINAVGPGGETISSGIYLKRSNNIKILGFTIRGTNEQAGTPQAYVPGKEYAMGILGYDNSNNIEIADNNISHVWGDGVYFSVEGNPNHDNWNIHHNLIELTGRQGIVPDSGRDIYIEWNIIRNIAMSSIDAEDERYSITGGEASLERVYVRNNLFDYWMHFGTSAYYYSCHAFPMDYSAGNLASMHDIYIENNTFQGGCVGPGNTFQNVTDDADISMWGSILKSNIFIRNNTFNLPANQRNGWAIRLNNVNGGQITGNTIPGQTVQCSSCINVTKQ